jgi:hypothetical protein
MNPESNMPQTLPPALVAKIEEEAEALGKTPTEWIEEALERSRRDRSWLETLRYGRERGARLLSPDASEEEINDLVNAKIAESRQERRGR